MKISKSLRATLIGLGVFTSSMMGNAIMAAEIPTPVELKAKAEKALSDLAIYKSPQNGFSIKYPTNWEKAEGPAPLVCRFLTDNGLVSYRISVEKLPTDMTAEKYAQSVNQELEKQYPLVGSPLTRIEESASKVGSVPAHKSIYSLKLATDGPSAKMLQYLIVANHRAYAFNYTAIEGAYDAFMPVISEILNSLDLQPVTANGAPEAKVESK